MSDFDRFSFKHRLANGGAVYGGPHELHNEVLITLPEGYFGEGNPWPAWVDVPGFAVEPANQVAPTAEEFTASINASGIHADDDPSMRPANHMDLPRKSLGKGKCDGCAEVVALRWEDFVVPQMYHAAVPFKVALCGDCWEVADTADVNTGAYGAASAELITASRVGGIQP